MSKQQPEPEVYSHDSSSTEEQDREGEGTTPSVVAANQFQSKKRESKLQSSHEDSEDGTKLSSTATSPKSQHSPTPTSTAEPILPSKPLKRTKRPLKVEPTEEKNEMVKQKKKNKVSEVCHDSTQPGDDTKKKPFERFWTEENEINLLNGLFDFKENGNAGDKIEFLKKYVDLDFNKRQLTDKLRRLQKRYETLLKKGKERCFKSDHERITYDISKKIWSKKKISSKHYFLIQDSEANNSKAVVGDSVVALRWKNEAKTPHKLKKAVSAEDIKAPAREKQNRSTLLNDLLHFNDASGFIGTSSNILEKGFSSLDSTTAAELKKNWRDLQFQELEIYMKRQALMVKQFQLILDALKSANI